MVSIGARTLSRCILPELWLQGPQRQPSLSRLRLRLQLATSSTRRSRGCTRVSTRQRISKMWEFIGQVWLMETIQAIMSSLFSFLRLSTWANMWRSLHPSEWSSRLMMTSAWVSLMYQLPSPAPFPTPAFTCVSTQSTRQCRPRGRLAIQSHSRLDPSPTPSHSDSPTRSRSTWHHLWHRTIS